MARETGGVDPAGPAAHFADFVVKPYTHHHRGDGLRQCGGPAARVTPAQPMPLVAPPKNAASGLVHRRRCCPASRSPLRAVHAGMLSKICQRRIGPPRTYPSPRQGFSPVSPALRTTAAARPAHRAGRLKRRNFLGNFSSPTTFCRDGRERDENSFGARNPASPRKTGRSNLPERVHPAKPAE